MTPTEAITALEKALEAGPTPGEWSLWGPAEPSQVIASANGFIAQTVGGNDGPNAAFIAACSPLAIRTLLDAHAGALRDAERYHWLRNRVSGVRDRHGVEEFDMPFVRPCIASIMKGSVAQHFDAAIDAQMAALATNTKAQP